MNDAIFSILRKLPYSNLYGFLTTSASTNILNNQTRPLFTRILMEELLNKQGIFVLLHTNSLKYPVAEHYILGFISFKTDDIIVFDSLGNGKSDRDYLITFLCLLNIVKAICQISQYVNFELEK